MFVILHNIRSTHNVGSIFRTADAAGVSRLYLTGYTPTPLDRFGRTRADIAKTALGAEKTVPWEYVKKLSAIVARLKKESVEIVAIEQSAIAGDYRHAHIEKLPAFIFGNEVRGLSKSALRQCDRVLEIPLRGKKESLNVSVAAGIILFHFYRRPF